MADSSADKSRKVAVIDQKIAQHREEIAKLQKQKERIQKPSFFGF